MSLITKRLKIIKKIEISSNKARKMRELGVSETNFYRWRDRYRKEGKAGLADKPRIPNNRPNSKSKELKTKICRYAKDDKFKNVSSLHKYLESEGESIHLQTVINILKGHSPPLYGMVEYQIPNPDNPNAMLIGKKTGLVNNGRKLIKLSK